MYAVVIPVYNERENLKELLPRLFRHTKNVIVVDDGSTDGGGELAAGLGARCIRHEQNLGKGAAIISGLGAAKTDYVILMDGDNQHSPEDIPLFLGGLEKSDLVIGNRFEAGVSMPLYRLLANRLVQFLVSRKIKGIHDPLNGFRAMKRDKFLGLSQKDFRVDLEILFVAKRANMKILEIPTKVDYRNNKRLATNLYRYARNYLNLLIYAIKRN